MDKENLRKFYQLVKEAREACAGSNIKSFDKVMELVAATMKYLLKSSKNGLNLKEWDFINKLSMVVLKIAVAEDYKDRLEPDDILCQICNELLKEIKE